MTTREILVLVIRSASLRSTLCARLSIEGETLTTSAGPSGDKSLARLARQPAILITDDPAVAIRSRSAAATGGWVGHILIAQHGTDAVVAEKFAIVEHAAAATQISETLARWRGRTVN